MKSGRGVDADQGDNPVVASGRGGKRGARFAAAAYASLVTGAAIVGLTLGGDDGLAGVWFVVFTQPWSMVAVIPALFGGHPSRGLVLTIALSGAVLNTVMIYRIGVRMARDRQAVYRQRAPETRLDTFAVVSLVLGLFGFSPAGLFAAFPAVVFGWISKRRIRHSTGLRGLGLAQAGLLLGAVGTFESAFGYALGFVFKLKGGRL